MVINVFYMKGMKGVEVIVIGVYDIMVYVVFYILINGG